MTEALIDLGALERNIRRVVDQIAPATLMAVVKADAYGHGAPQVARAAVAQGVTWLGVLDAETGQRLRESGIGPDIRMFAWLFSPDEHFRRLIDADIDLGISQLYQLELIAASGATQVARVHLKIDTGLHRNGSTPELWPVFIARALELQAAGLVQVCGAWTHIGEASDAEDTLAIARFDAALEVAASLGADIRVRHLAASAAGFSRDDARFDLVRTGAFLYGIAPGDGVGPADIGIEPVMTLQARVSHVDSEGLRTRVWIAAGWLDGIPAHAAGLVQVAIGGVRHPIVTVSASVLECEVVGVAVRSGDVATLFGPGTFGEQNLAEWADALGTIGEEIVVGIPARVRRRYTGS